MGKSKLGDFVINLAQLSNNIHNFDFEIDRSFFELFEQDLLKDGNLSVKVVLSKSENLIKLNFDFAGEVELTCDRSLEKFKHKLDFEKELFLKYGKEHAELDENLIQIPDSQETVELAQTLFEYLTLEIPLKKLHPKYSAIIDVSENDEMVFSTEKDQIEKEEKIDPRWDKLRDIDLK